MIITTLFLSLLKNYHLSLDNWYLIMLKKEQLSHIELNNFKSIKSLNLDLRKLNILLGQNGAGKTNFMSFFILVNKINNQDLQLYVAEQGVDRLLHFGLKHSQTIKFSITFKKNSYHVTLIPTTNGHLIFKEEYLQSNNNKKEYLHSVGAPESLFSKKDASSVISKIIADWKVYHFHDTSQTSQLKGSCNINDNDYLRPHAENLAAFLYSIKDGNEYLKILRTIQRVAPFIQDFILKPDKLNTDYIRLRWKHQGSDAYFDAHSLSDGTLRFICLAILLLQPSPPSIILLDEPELGLHPYAIQLLGALIKSASHKTQIIVSTQSVTLSNEFSWQDIIIVQQENNTSKFHRLNKKQIEPWIKNYALGEIWQKNLIGGTPSC